MKKRRLNTTAPRLFKFAMKWWIATLLVFVGQVSAAEITVNESDTDAINRIKSAYLYNFLKYVEFESFQAMPAKTNYQVCVLGVDPFGKIIDALNGRSAKGLIIQISRMLDTDQAKFCDVVFVSRSKRLELKPVLAALRQSPILTVSDIENFAQMGGIVEFTSEKGKIGITVNLGEARRAKIRISAMLLEVASVIDKAVDS